MKKQIKYNALCMCCGFEFEFKGYLKGNEIYTCPRCQSNLAISRDLDLKLNLINKGE